MRSIQFSNRLAEAMGDKGLTQEQLAALVNKSQATVSRWLSGSMPRHQVAVTLAKSLDVDLVWLVQGQGEKRSYGGYASAGQFINVKRFDSATESEKKRIVRVAFDNSKSLFPSRLRTLREKLRLSIGQFAKQCGYSVSYISRIESAARKKPSWEFTDCLVEKFKVRREWLFFGEGEIFHTGNMRDVTEATKVYLRQLNAADGNFQLDSGLKKFFESSIDLLKMSDADILRLSGLINESEDLPPEHKTRAVRILAEILVKRLSK